MKNLIITGGAGGIGSLITRNLYQKGYSITILGKDKDKFKKSFNKEMSIKFYSIDISDIQQVLNFYVKYKFENNSLYGLINIAGIQPPIGEFVKNDSFKWINNINVNLIGTANMIRGAIPLLKEGKNGRIINFSGGGATGPRPNFSAYALSKVSIVRFTEILAIELKKYSINVNAIAPGEINTEMLQEIIDSGKELSGDEYNSAKIRNKLGGDDPQKAVDLCTFLLSKKSHGISGKLISAIWDKYNEKGFLQKLKKDDDFCTIRRIDELNYYKK